MIALEADNTFGSSDDAAIENLRTGIKIVRLAKNKMGKPDVKTTLPALV